MRGNRVFVFLVAILVVAGGLFAFFGKDIGRRALPPQANVPDLPPVGAPQSASVAPMDPALASLPPSFDVVRISGNCTAVIAGRAAPGALVTVKADEGELGRVTADGAGTWALVPDLPLQKGSRELSLASQLQDRAPIESKSGVVVMVPDCANGERSGDQAIAVLTPQKGASRLLQGPADGDAAALSAKGLALDTIDYDEKGNLILSGRARPGSTVQVYINNQPVGAPTADAKGNWQLQVDHSVPPGVYTLRIDQVEDTGKVVSRLETPFQRATAADLAAREGNIVVQPGNSLWRIARQHYGDGVQYTVIFQANKDRIRDPDMIYPGQVFALPKDAKPSTPRTN